MHTYAVAENASSTEIRRLALEEHIVAPKRHEPHRLRLIEKTFNDEGIQVVWQNESIEDVKKRMASPDSPPE